MITKSKVEYIIKETQFEHKALITIHYYRLQELTSNDDTKKISKDADRLLWPLLAEKSQNHINFRMAIENIGKSHRDCIQIKSLYICFLIRAVFLQITVILYAFISTSLKKNKDLLNPFVQKYTK